MLCMPRVVVDRVARQVPTRQVEVPLEEMGRAEMQTQWRRTELLTPAVAVAVHRTVLAVAVDQESSLFVMQFLLLRLFRRPQ